MSCSPKKEILLFDEIDGYRIIKLIGQGGCSYIYFVRDIQTNSAFAMKFVQKESQKLLLEIERSVMSEINDDDNFPKFIKSGVYFDQKYIVMELLGPSLDAIRKLLPQKKLSLCSVILVAMKTLDIIECFHQRGFVHRDIKPSNFLLKRKSTNEFCLIDFGLSKRHIDPKTEKPHEKQKTKSFVGTARYCSINAHNNEDVGRCDDLISWFYMCVDFFAGKLPWSDVTDKELILLIKEKTADEELCEGLPEEFLSILKYIKSLTYYDEPDYCFISRKLTDALNKLEMATKDLFDWETIPLEELETISHVRLKRNLSDVFDKQDNKCAIPRAPSKAHLANKSVHRSASKVLLSDINEEKVEEVESSSNPCCICF